MREVLNLDLRNTHMRTRACTHTHACRHAYIHTHYYYCAEICDIQPKAGYLLAHRCRAQFVIVTEGKSWLSEWVASHPVRMQREMDAGW